MEWEQQILHNGEPNKHRELSTCGKYVIAQYSYHPQRGTCKPYWVGYLRKSGDGITDRAGLTYRHVKIAVAQYDARRAGAAVL